MYFPPDSVSIVSEAGDARKGRAFLVSSNGFAPVERGIAAISAWMPDSSLTEAKRS